MPNWCDCELDIEGEGKELKRFKAFAQTRKGKEVNVLDTKQFIPYPKKFEELDKKARDWEEKADKFAKKQGCDSWYCGDKLSDKLRKQFEVENPPIKKDGFNSGGYTWCIENWGTKWGICHAEIDREDYKYGELSYVFDTAWSPCYPVILKMSKMFPKLKFSMRYFEGGMGFNGLFECEKGKEKTMLQGDYFGNRGG